MIPELETDRARGLIIRDIIRTPNIVNQLGITLLLEFTIVALYRQSPEAPIANSSKNLC
jgi:hypothetical protein